MKQTETYARTGNRPKFLQQFERYLQDITDINELHYIFNSSKASETQVKNAFKELFVAKKVEIFDAMRPELKLSLELESVADLTSSKIDGILNAFIKSE
ncbi:MAG: hypothetical protein IPM42_04625 [Saprospiraceae bacterium]|nr:hypothetical protein [Saprospiraceae bacterium]